MNERIAVLLVALVLEMLGGLGLRNETLASRGRIEVHRRCSERCEARIDLLQAIYHQVTSPANLQREIERRKLQREVENLHQL